MDTATINSITHPTLKREFTSFTEEHFYVQPVYIVNVDMEPVLG